MLDRCKRSVSDLGENLVGNRARACFHFLAGIFEDFRGNFFFFRSLSF